MKDLIKITIAVILTITIVCSLDYLFETACNPKGSLAADINWAGRPACK